MSSFTLKSYFQSTRTATYGYLAAMPLLLAYEVLILTANPESQVEIRVGADVWIKQFLGAIGVRGQHTLVLITLISGIVIVFNERKKQVVLNFTYFSLLIVESLFYSIFLAAIISRTVGYIFGNLDLSNIFALQIHSFASDSNFWLHIALSIGAGIYEELFFRVFLISGLYFLFNKILLNDRSTAYFFAALLAAFLFSGVHYIGPFGDAFAIRSFTFRFLFGLAFNILYVFRGFGIVAWAHALYDILLTISLK